MTDHPVESEGEPQETAAPSGDNPQAADSGAESAETAAAPGSGDDSGSEAASTSASDELALAKIAADERLLDLQRLQAEYVNYKRRVDRDRERVREDATYKALVPIIDVLDTIDRAREHGEVEGGFKAVADQLERVVADAGLVRFGAVGDAFDPAVHEALSHIGQDPEVEVTTCKVIAKAGYRIGDRVVRAAQVLVVDPQE